MWSPKSGGTVTAAFATDENSRISTEPTAIRREVKFMKTNLATDGAPMHTDFELATDEHGWTQIRKIRA
jgi:hypothetical protein